MNATTTDQKQTGSDLTHEDVEAHSSFRNANEPVDEDVDAHARMNGNANEPVDEDSE